MFESPSNQYYFGQFLKFEASVKQYSHVPLRIYVDGCVATAAPDVNTTTTSPRYSFIENHGLVKNCSSNPLLQRCILQTIFLSLQVPDRCKAYRLQFQFHESCSE